MQTSEGGKRTRDGKSDSPVKIPEFSVVTVVRNAVSFLEQTILSVLEQSFENIEYIIIDGGSSDGTLELIKKYDDKIDFWISEPDNGIYDAMNKGISVATGQWLNFMNAGDVFRQKSTCSIIAENLLIRDCDIIYGDFIAVDSSTKGEIVVKAGDPGSFWKGMIFSHQSSFVKTAILKITPFNCKYKLASDYDQFYSLYARGYSFHYLPDVISKVMIGGLSYSRSRTVYEQIKISGTHKKLSFRILYFVYPLFVNLAQIIAGQKVTGIVRKIKWKIFYNKTTLIDESIL